MNQKVLEVAGLSKLYGETAAVDGISFDIARNEIVGLLGPNGAGKTTTISMILGVLSPSSGSIRIEGADISSRRASALEHTNFAAVYAPLPGNLTVYENLKVFGLIYGVENLSEKIDSLLDRFDLGRHRNVKCGLLSSGEQTRAGIAKAMLNEPHLLLLDEPTASLVPFLLVLFLFGMALGIFSCAVVLRFGPASEWLIWPVPAIISPFAGVFYPVAVLPPWMRGVSRLLPPSYVFESMRSAVLGGGVSWSALLLGAGLSVFYILSAVCFFVRMHRRAVDTGLITRYSAETAG